MAWSQSRISSSTLFLWLFGHGKARVLRSAETEAWICEGKKKKKEKKANIHQAFKLMKMQTRTQKKMKRLTTWRHLRNSHDCLILTIRIKRKYVKWSIQLLFFLNPIANFQNLRHKSENMLTTVMRVNNSLTASFNIVQQIYLYYFEMVRDSLFLFLFSFCANAY